MAAALWPPDVRAGSPTVRLRHATAADAERLAELYQTAGAAHGAAQVRGWLEKGGALLVEREGGPVLASVRWRPTQSGWAVERVTTRPDERGNGFGRWLMTKLEALAIRGNVPTIELVVEEDDLLPYYRRMGYQSSEASPNTLTKRVGGVWQRQVPAGNGRLA